MRRNEERIKIADYSGIARAMAAGARLAEIAGFDKVTQAALLTAISELATNILTYAGKGRVTVRIVKKETKKGIEIVAEDNGPGIPNVEEAMMDGFTTAKSLGIGLGGVRRLMDEFEISTSGTTGTTITTRKWG